MSTTGSSVDGSSGRSWRFSRISRPLGLSPIRTELSPEPKNVISACSLRSSSFASARTLPRVSVTSGVLVTAWLKR